MEWVIVTLLILIVLQIFRALGPLFDIKFDLKQINENLLDIRADKYESMFYELKNSRIILNLY